MAICFKYIAALAVKKHSDQDIPVMTLRVNSGCNKRQRLEGNKVKSKLVKCKEYKV
jgi:hypothetical protein